MANKIQLRRDTTANWTRVNPILDDGEPGLDITTNQVKYGDGANVWVDLSYASGGGVTFNADGMLELSGNLWVGTWKDGDSVLWADDTVSEYVGLWYGGERANVPGSGPNVSITVGNVSLEDGMPGSWDDGLQINLDVDDKNWHFDADGVLTLPTGGHIGPGGGKGEGTTLGGANDHFVSLTSYYDSGNYSSCITANADGTLDITAYNDGGPDPAKIWSFANDGILKMPPGNETTAGWIQWSHASDDLTNVAGAGFVDYFNAYNTQQYVKKTQ